MSSENIDQNLNNNLEQVQGQTEIIPSEKNCDIPKSDVEMTNIDKAENENTEVLTNDVPISCDSPGGSEQFVVEPKNNMDQNLNTIDTVSVVDNVREVVDSVNYDISNVVVVENITNILTEKSMRNIDDVSDSCESPGTKRAKSTAQPKRSTEKLIQDTLIHKVNELDISGRVNQHFQNNKSSVVLKMKTDSLKNLLAYDNSSDDDDEDFEKNWQLLAVPDSFSDSESESNESIESSDDDTDDVSSSVIFGQKNNGAIKKDTSKKAAPTKSITGILDPHDLPPIPDLSSLDINVEKEEFLHMGCIQAIIDTLVTIEANPNMPAYDLDSYLFIEDKTTKKPLGAIYDVIGPVTSPIYCIRYNSTKDIQDLQLKQGMKVFSAPKSQYTHYVFVKELMQFKGTDASWVGDKEIPPEVAAELSDDEDEHNLQNARKAEKRKHGSLERHKQFEKSMNRCNTLNTRVAQLVDAHRHLPRPIRYNDYGQRSLLSDFRSVANRIPVPFDPTVPPPGFHGYSRESNLPNVRPPMHWNWLPHEVHRPSMPRPNMSPFTQGQNNSANYYTNNAGRNHSAGSSTQPY